MTHLDGGAAFPGVPTDEYNNGGMSLRDWFAGMALPACVSMKAIGDHAWILTAERAYAIADALLQHREKQA